MIRDYKIKPDSREYRNYNEAQLEGLRKVVEESMKTRTANQEYKIPFGTLNNKLHGRNVAPKMTEGQSHAEEIAILNSAVKSADWGFPLSNVRIENISKISVWINPVEKYNVFKTICQVKFVLVMCVKTA